MNPFPEKKYHVIYADPPWRYNFSRSDSRAIENQYNTMSLEDIKNLPVKEIAWWGSVLFLWVTSPKVPEGLEVMKAWGFDYVTSGVWVKRQMGMGYYFRQCHEWILVGKIGHLPVSAPFNRVRSVFETEAEHFEGALEFFADRSKHSQKPDSVRDAITKMYPNLDKIELFARSKHPDWDSWGNEV